MGVRDCWYLYMFCFRVNYLEQCDEQQFFGGEYNPLIRLCYPCNLLCLLIGIHSPVLVCFFSCVLLRTSLCSCSIRLSLLTEHWKVLKCNIFNILSILYYSDVGCEWFAGTNKVFRYKLVPLLSFLVMYNHCSLRFYSVWLKIQMNI